MNWDEKVGTEGAALILVTLSGMFVVKRPKLRKGRRGYATRGNSGHYDPRRQSICLGPECKTWVVAHEFAHHLDYLINRPENPGAKTRQTEWHSRSFYNNLKRVIEALGGGEYPWPKEYRTLARWARLEAKP